MTLGPKSKVRRIFRLPQRTKRSGTSQPPSPKSEPTQARDQSRASPRIPNQRPPLTLRDRNQRPTSRPRPSGTSRSPARTRAPEPPALRRTALRRRGPRGRIRSARPPSCTRSSPRSSPGSPTPTARTPAGTPSGFPSRSGGRSCRTERKRGAAVVADAASRRHDRRYGVGVELSGDGQAEPLLVEHDGGLELVVEDIGEITGPRRFLLREIAEAVEVLLELAHAAHVAAPLGVEESREVVPRGVIVVVVVAAFFGGCYGNRFGYDDSGGKTWAGKEEEEEEEEEDYGIITEKQNHNNGFVSGFEPPGNL
ncbi:hypothetical protein G2W53_036844 [Senna tora]|uniref:Uncharacterized protein n=1 Tax=Senna tora TaxID=362788 RepID=A0A834SUN6_9FABA|nr:hypothetical protein G2W53_036844 [Senna tora]